MKEKILVVDDEPDILNILETILTKEKFRVHTASEGAEAIALFESESFDLVLTDIQMPRMDGLELIKQIREKDNDVEIIVLTGFPSLDIAIRSLKGYRAYDFLTKPIQNMKYFLISVKRGLERRQLRKEKAERNAELYATNKRLEQEIKERKQTEKILRQREKELEIKTEELEAMNSALKVLLKKRDEDKKNLEDKVLFNVNELVMPFFEKLKNSGLNDRQKGFADVMESNLNDIVSSFAHGMPASYLKLTPSEIHVANLVKYGRSTKDIAELLGLSVRTIETHRDNVRKKMGLKNKKVNLRTHLLSLHLLIP